MPTYPAYKTYRGGFYNNQKVNGVDDRVYTAEDIRKPYDTIFTDGILPEADGTAGDNLKVSSIGNFTISLAVGKAKIGGAWFENASPYNIILDTASDTDRYDCVIIRNDDSDAVREPTVYIKSQSVIPTVNDLTKTDKIDEICVAYIRIPAFAVEITASNIVDTREDGSLCNTMRGVGATVVRTYRNTYFSVTAGEQNIPIGIPQYNRSRDTLTVIVEGRVFAEGVNYTITNNSTIRLAIGLPVIGTRIDFEVSKNVNAAGAETVVQEVGELRKEMTVANRHLEHHYYCNGLNDNVRLSEIAQQWLSVENRDNATIYVHGHFGATGAYSGNGTSANPAVWFALGKNAAHLRKITFDFSDCGEIRLSTTANSYNIIFDGNEVNIIGATVIAVNGTMIKMFTATGSAVINAKECRFWITTTLDAAIARGGRFDNCFAKVIVNTAEAICFEPNGASLLRLNGGEYLAYTGSTTANASVVRIVEGATEVVALTNGINCPQVSQTGLRQTHAVYDQSANGHCVYADTITTLPITATSQVVRNTIELSKPNMM